MTMSWIVMTDARLTPLRLQTSVFARVALWRPTLTVMALWIAWMNATLIQTRLHLESVDVVPKTLTPMAMAYSIATTNVLMTSSSGTLVFVVATWQIPIAMVMAYMTALMSVPTIQTSGQ